MPCLYCERRASVQQGQEPGSGAVVGKIHYEEDGEMYYTCLDCTLKKLKTEIEKE